MSLPRTMQFVLSRAVLLIVIVFVSVRISSAANVTVKDADRTEGSTNYKIIIRKDPLELKCSFDGEGSIIWRKKGASGYEEVKDASIKNDGKESTLKYAKPGDENAGLYQCAIANNSEITPGEFNVLALPHGFMEPDVIVVEGERLALDCQPTGVPTPQVFWIIGENTTLNESTDRINVSRNKNNVPNAFLEIRDAKMSDRGDYKCKLVNHASIILGKDVEFTSKVRVKDKLAALWPFLGICAEVFVLCAIIFIYEKKRNKAELDESDTDNSPEQKNTPDHAKDSVRQRK